MPAIQQKSLQQRLMQHHTTCDKMELLKKAISLWQQPSPRQ